MDKQHGYTVAGTAPAYANVTVKLAEGGDHQNDDRIVLSVRSSAKGDGSLGDLGSIVMTRREFTDFIAGAREALAP